MSDLISAEEELSRYEICKRFSKKIKFDKDLIYASSFSSEALTEMFNKYTKDCVIYDRKNKTMKRSMAATFSGFVLALAFMHPAFFALSVAGMGTFLYSGFTSPFGRGADNSSALRKKFKDSALNNLVQHYLISKEKPVTEPVNTLENG